MVKKRIIVFVGITVMESIIHFFFGVPIFEAVTPVMVGNLAATQFAHMVYTGKLFRGS